MPFSSHPIRGTTAALTALVLAALVLAGCALDAGGAPQVPVVTPASPGVGAPDGAAVGPVPPGLDRFYRQRLTWGGCGEFATTDTDATAFETPGLQCTRVEVPLDYAKPEGRTARLGVLRRPADEPGVRVGSLLLNPGGPGASGMSTAASLSSAVAGTELGRRLDLVGFDPRGIGASEPKILCRTTQEQDAERLDLDLDTSPAGVAQTEAEDKAYAALCSKRVGNDVLANSGTRDVARDMDVLRAALGDAKLTYLGYSYGTRIGTEYAKQFPRNVRAMVLDGALDPDESLVESLVNQGAGFQKSFNAFVDWCVGQPSCWLGGTPKEQASKKFQEQLRPLTTAALPVGNRKLSYTDATTGAIQALYSDQLWPLLNKGLSELAAGDGTLLLTLADVYYQRDPRGYSGSEDAFVAIRCLDDPPVTDPTVIREADRRYREVAPFLDDGHPPSAARDVCAFWPVPPTSQPEVPKVQGLTPVMVISTTGDPATPYQAGVELARQLGAQLLSFHGNQHTIALQGVKCVDDAVANYLIRLELPKRQNCFP
ncbi:MAG TPA: alpha/beta hydrolase [Pseudonocardiaceae bacterium]|nr:alpha/beta hydrolase [Pseudonocardiaceae bacterium]